LANIARLSSLIILFFVGSQAFAQCDPALVECGDIAITGLNVTAPDANGYVTVTPDLEAYTSTEGSRVYSIELQAIKPDNSTVTLQVPSKDIAPGQGCASGGGWGTCSGCDEQCNYCYVCKGVWSPSGTYCGCRCFADTVFCIFTGFPAVQLPSGTTITVVLDPQNNHAEDYEGNNSFSTTVP